MSDFPRPDFARPAPEPSLDEIRRTDDFIEALSSGRPVVPQDHADAALAARLGGWRNENRWPPDVGLISEAQAIAALNAGLAEKPAREPRNRHPNPGRNRRGLSVVGAAAAAVLCIGGFGAVVNGAGPGDSLYGLRTMLFGTPREVRDDQVALAARSELVKVQELISQGDWQQAQAKLVAVSTQVAAVGDEEQKQELLTQFNDLSAKVVERNPEATAPPGIVYTVPPSATELVPTPAPLTDSATTGETTTSVPTAPTTSGEATSGTEVSGASSSSSPAPTSGAPSSSAQSSAGPSSSAASSAPSSAGSSAATSASQSAAATSTTAATSTPASTSAPGSSATSASPAAPASTTGPVQSPATSSAPAAAAATTSTTSASQSAAAATTTPTSAAPKSAGTTAESTSQASAAADADTAASDAVTETTAQTATAEATTAAPAITTTMVPESAG